MQHTDTNTTFDISEKQAVVAVTQLVGEAEGVVRGAFGVCLDDGRDCYVNGRVCSENNLVKGSTLKCLLAPNPVLERRDRTPYTVATVIAVAHPKNAPPLQYAGPKTATPTSEYAPGEQMPLPIPATPPKPKPKHLFEMEGAALDAVVLKHLRTHRSTAFTVKGLLMGLLDDHHPSTDDTDTPDRKKFYDRLRNRLQAGYEAGQWALLQASNYTDNADTGRMERSYGWPLYTVDRNVVYSETFKVQK